MAVYKALSPPFVIFLAIGVAGCGGGHVARTREVAADPAVKWICSAGTELTLGFWWCPMLTPTGISGGAVIDDRIILLCNLGGPTEALTASRVYVLDLETGKVRKNIAGPTPTSWRPWIITSDRAYFRHDVHKGWVALDLGRGTVDWNPPPPPELKSAALPRELHRKETYLDRESGCNRQEYGLGVGRALSRTTAPWKPYEYELTCTRADGVSVTHHLCTLPHRPYPCGKSALIADDADHLIFYDGEFLISIDPRRIAD